MPPRKARGAPTVRHIRALAIWRRSQAALDSDHYRTPLEGPNVGRGVASGYWFNVGLQSSVSINVNADGSVTLVEGSTDIGGTRASIAMQAAEILGLKAEEVRPIVADTASVGYNDVTGGSRTTFASGYAAIEAAQDVVRQMTERAARIWKVEPSEVTFADGVFHQTNAADQHLTFQRGRRAAWDGREDRWRDAPR